MQYVTLGDTTMHVEAAPRDGGPTVVFINSLGSDLRIWDDVAAALGAAGVGALRYDLRGHGLSDLGTPPKTLMDHAADLAGILDAVGLARATICAVSVGGAIALGLADAYPERIERLVLCCTGAKMGTEEAWNQRIAAVERDGVAAVAEGVLQRWFPPDDYARGGGAVALCRNMLVNTSRAGYAATCVALRDSDLTEAAKRVKAPALVIGCEFDGSTPPDSVREFARLVPGAEFHFIAGAGHLPSVQQPAALTAEILAFLGR
ncbi:MAG: 3-oxoadipate enol-lactonase [Roseiarcus sp.]